MGTIDLDNARRKMEGLRQQLEQDLFAIEDSRSYSDAGRRMETAKAKLAARKQAEQWRDDLLAIRNSEHLRLERHAFGIQPGGDPRSYRDAVDRVQEFKRDPNKVEAALDTAIRTNDTELVRVIAGWAYNAGQSSLLDTASRHIEVSSRMLVDELRDLPSEGDIKRTFLLPGAETSDLSYYERAEAEKAIS